MKIIAMKCPGCGAGLEVSSDMNSFACGYCGTALQAVRSGGTVRLDFIANSVDQVRSHTGKIAAELALVRLEKELNNLQWPGPVYSMERNSLQAELRDGKYQWRLPDNFGLGIIGWMIVLFTIGYIFSSILFSRIGIYLPLVYLGGKALEFLISNMRENKIKNQISMIDEELEPIQKSIRIENEKISKKQDDILRKIAKIKTDLDTL